MDSKTFARQAYRALNHLDEVLGDLELEELDVNLAGDVLTLTFGDGSQFVINAHSAAEQVWMAANRSAWHFDLVPEDAGPEDDARWVAHKTDDELMATVAHVVSEKLGRPVEV